MNERESEVLEKYPFRVERMSRVRGAFLCETEDGLRLPAMGESDSSAVPAEPPDPGSNLGGKCGRRDPHGEQRPPGLLREAMAGGQRV